MLVLYHHGGWGYLGSDLNAMLLHWLGEFLRGVGMNDKFRGYLFLLVHEMSVSSQSSIFPEMTVVASLG
jgi:hypothetical protein